MQSTILGISFSLLFNIYANAQITEYKTTNNKWQMYGQIKTIGNAKASLEYIANEKDSTFLLMMRDERPELKSYFSSKFSSSGNTVSTLYNILISFFEEKNSRDKDYIRIFRLGNEEVTVFKTFVIGTRTIILKTNKGRIALRKGEIEKLFNK